MNKNRLLAFILVIVLISTGFYGCSKKEEGKSDTNAGSGSGTAAATDGSGEATEPEVNFEEEPYHATLMYFAANEAADDLDLVEARFNELTKAQLNMEVDLMPVTIGTYNQQIQLMLAGGEPLDIFPMFLSNAGTYIDAQYIVDLSDLIYDYGKDIIDIVGEDDIWCASVGDFLWGVPVMMERAHPSAFVLRNDILTELGINAADINGIEGMGEVFAKVHEAYPDMTVFGGTAGMDPSTIDNSIDDLGDRFGILANYGAEPKVTNWYETDRYKELVNYTRDWYLQGYVSKDLATSTDSGEALMKAGNLFAFCCNAKPNSKQEKDAMTGFDTAIVTFDDPLLTTNMTGTIGYSIANNSEDPAKAVQLYNWVIKTEEANDLLNWGIEGKHWAETPDGTIDYPEGVTMDSVGYHQDFGWAMPNQMNSHIWKGNAPDIWEQYRAFRDEAHKSAAYGFTFDITPVVNEIAALTSVKAQYSSIIGSGSVDPDATLKEFNDALYAAGLQKVMDEKQKQLDEWLASHK